MKGVITKRKQMQTNVRKRRHRGLHREGVNREKLTMKKIINNEMFFSPFMSLINREKLCVNRENRHQKSNSFSSLAFHRLRLLEFRLFGIAGR